VRNARSVMTDSIVIKRAAVTLGPVHIAANGVQTEFPVPKQVVDTVPSTGSHVLILRHIFCFWR